MLKFTRDSFVDVDTYNEHFQYELNHTAFTVFKKGVYPTKDDAERAIYAGDLI